MSNRTLPNSEFGGPISKNYNYSYACPLNEINFTVPCNQPVKWDTVLANPTTLKSQYKNNGTEAEYPNMTKVIPRGTLYDHDFSQYYRTGMGRQKLIGGGNYKTWPATNIHIVEDVTYTDDYWKRPGYCLDSVTETQPTHLRSNGWNDPTLRT
jgi:hypothetical protein